MPCIRVSRVSETPKLPHGKKRSWRGCNPPASTFAQRQAIPHIRVPYRFGKRDDIALPQGCSIYYSGTLSSTLALFSDIGPNISPQDPTLGDCSNKCQAHAQRIRSSDGVVLC